MGIIVKDKVYEQMTEGLHSVTITEVKDLGVVDTQYGSKDRARIVFTALDQKDSKTGDPINVFMTVTKSLHKKSALAKTLLQLGVTAGEEFDLDDLIGTKCSIVVEHKESDGKTYANVQTILKRRKDSAEV